MPFESFAQEAYLKHNHPSIYKRWMGEHGHYKGKKKHVSDKQADVKETHMALTFPERVIETLQISALALQKAEAEAAEKTAADKRYSDKIASVVEACVKNRRIDNTPDEREKLAAWLSTPEGALEVIEKLAEHEVEPEPTPELGKQVDASGRPAGQSKRASSEPKNGAYVGRRSSEEPESWRKMASALGIA